MDEITTYFGNQEDILAAYLFGSRANGKFGPGSDYDIGIFLAKSISFSKKFYLEVDIRNILNTTSLDLVVMNEAPIALKYNIICGQCIYAVDKETRVEIEADILSRYFDFLPVLKKHNSN